MSDLGAPLPLHVSLSRPIGFATERKDAFVTAVKRNIDRCGVRPFEVNLIDLSWVPNLEGTRWFLVLHLARPDGDELNKLLGVCNIIVQEHGQLPLYVDPTAGATHAARAYDSPRPEKRARNEYPTPTVGGQDFAGAFHISIGWTLKPPETKTIDATTRVVEHTLFMKIKQICFTVEEVKAKVGNNVTSICLPTKVVERKSLFGS